MKVRVQLVENNPLHKIPTVIINVHTAQFIFNVIPTLVRHRKKHKINLYNSYSIFFTKNSVEAMGGLPNLLLFRTGSEKFKKILTNKICMFGDKSLIQYFQKLRFKLGFKILRASYTDWEKKICRFGIFSPSLYHKLKQSPNLPQIFAKIENYFQTNVRSQDYFISRLYLREQKTKYIDINCTHYHTKLLDIYPLINKNRETTLTSYIIVLAERIKDIDFDLQKFTSQTNIKKQKDIKQFQAAKSITRENITYKWENFLFKQNAKPTNIMILHHQNDESISELLNNEIWKNYFTKANKTGLVVHIVQDITLFQSPLLKQLVSIFQPTTKHLWFNNQMHNIEQSQINLQENLLVHSLWSEQFPIQLKNIKNLRFKHVNKSSNKKVQEIFSSFSHLLYKRVYHYIKDDFLGGFYSERMQVNPKEGNLILTKLAIQKRIEQLNSLRSKQQIAFQGFQPKVVFLGTSSSMPTIDRNTSGILISLFKNSSLLFDCGEQTFEQIVNHFSPEKLQEELLKIKVIFITHIHSDHNLGILNLISYRRRLMKKKKTSDKVFLMIPFDVFNWYESYNLTIQNLSDSCQVIFTQLYLNQSLQILDTNQKNQFSCNDSDFDQKFDALIGKSAKNKYYVKNYLNMNGNNVDNFKNFLQQTGYVQFLPLRVIHCPQSFGITVSSSQFKVSYSGDTRPSLDFQSIAKNSNIMIHQATFNDEEAKKAQISLHSTVQQAVNIGLSSQSKLLVLTHFNEDFKYPQFIKNQQTMNYFNKNTILAFDHLQVPLNKHYNLCQISKKVLEVSKQVQKKSLNSKVKNENN